MIFMLKDLKTIVKLLKEIKELLAGKNGTYL